MNDAFKAWLDEMPIDDVRARIERLERKLADLRVIERLYSERHSDAGAQTTPEPVPEPNGGESTEPIGTDEGSEPDAEQSDFGSPPM